MEIDPTTDEPVWIFPFESMEIGESFFIPTLLPANMLYVVDTRAKVAKVKVKAYVTSCEGYLGVRVWRIA